ncbi:MAG: alpha/beta fold hydrolase [Thermoanaerobaculia bacterium]
MPKYWMVTNRNRTGSQLGAQRVALTYWVAEEAPLEDLSRWSQLSAGKFKEGLLNTARTFPALQPTGEHVDQKHVCLFVHGYNSSWAEAVGRYEKLCHGLFAGDAGLGSCVLFTWPSHGSPADYLPDRSEARESSQDLAELLVLLYEWLLRNQAMATRSPEAACRAKTSLIAHSMGNYVLQKAMQLAWSRKNKPLLVSLINQLVMVAADVDNDLFASGDRVDGSDGDAMANLTYRVSALYSGRDAVLGMSAGLKHFGKRRLGRSGLDPNVPRPDNVWDFDCSGLFPPDQPNIHSAYFELEATLDLMRDILKGIDRKELRKQY